MLIVRVIGVVILGLVLAATNSAGSGVADKKQVKEKTTHKGSKASFQDHEIRIIVGYFKDTKNLPPGLAKRDSLPPGLAKQVRERGTLPPGLEKRMQLLPADLEIKLLPLPESLIRVVIGVDVVLMDTVDNVILDVIENVFE